MKLPAAGDGEGCGDGHAVPWLDLDQSVLDGEVLIEAMNRNGRRPKKANHGKRPCCHWGRRKKRVK